MVHNKDLLWIRKRIEETNTDLVNALAEISRLIMENCENKDGDVTDQYTRALHYHVHKAKFNLSYTTEEMVKFGV